MINIGVDGACKGNPGVGGWGVSIFEDDRYHNGMCGGDMTTTNNRMELTAFLEACKLLDDERPSDRVTIWLDSTYVLKGCTEWLRGWRQKNYKNVKNADLWRDIAELRHVWLECEMKWCKGHRGNIFNEKADELANQGVQDVRNANDGW